LTNPRFYLLEMSLKIPIILGTARVGRRSEKVARYMLGVAKEYGLNTYLIDVKDFIIGYTDDKLSTEAAKRYKELMRDIDGLIIVTPEYSHGFPGELKILMDTIYKEYYRRPLGIVAVSSGRGGARAVDSIRTIAIDLGFVPIKQALYFAPVDEILSDDSRLVREEFRSSIDRFMRELIWFAETLRYGRLNIKE